MLACCRLEPGNKSLQADRAACIASWQQRHGKGRPPVERVRIPITNAQPPTPPSRQATTATVATRSNTEEGDTTGISSRVETAPVNGGLLSEQLPSQVQQSAASRDNGAERKEESSKEELPALTGATVASLKALGVSSTAWDDDSRAHESSLAKGKQQPLQLPLPKPLQLARRPPRTGAKYRLSHASCVHLWMLI